MTDVAPSCVLYVKRILRRKWWCAVSLMRLEPATNCIEKIFPVARISYFLGEACVSLSTVVSGTAIVVVA